MSDRYLHHLVIRGESTFLFDLYKREVEAAHEQNEHPTLAWLDELMVLFTRSGMEPQRLPNVEATSFAVVVPESVSVRFETDWMEGIEEFVAAVSRIPSVSAVRHESYAPDGTDDVLRRTHWERGYRVAAGEGALFVSERFDPYRNERVEVCRVALLTTYDLRERTKQFAVELNGEVSTWAMARAFAAAVLDEEHFALLEEAFRDFRDESLTVIPA